MTSGGRASFPGALPLVSESIALLRSSCVGSMSSSGYIVYIIMIAFYWFDNFRAAH